MKDRLASVIVAAALALGGCAASTHATQPAILGVPRPSSEMIASIDEPGPIAVESIASVRERFRAALADEGEQLAVAVTPRMLLDDIAPCVSQYHARSPKTRFTFWELSDEEVAGAVLERQVDFGFTPTPLTAANTIRPIEIHRP